MILLGPNNLDITNGRYYRLKASYDIKRFISIGIEVFTGIEDDEDNILFFHSVSLDYNGIQVGDTSLFSPMNGKISIY